MPFNKDEYKKFLTEHARHDTDPVDLLQRYAIMPSMSDAQVKDHVTAVRAFWNQNANGNSKIARKADWCRKRDTELKNQHGDSMLTTAWWQQAAAAQARDAQEKIQRLAASLIEDYGKVGAVTAASLATYGGKQGLSHVQAAQAASQARVIVIPETTKLPDLPINATQFKNLVQNLSECRVRTVPELLHPGSGPFWIVERYKCQANPALRLDKDAINQQKAAAGKAINAANTAKGEALAKLADAIDRQADLRDVALYHLAERVKGTPAAGAKRELIELGVIEDDAAIIAALLEGHQQPEARMSPQEQVRTLLAEGTLREAAQLESTLPDGDDKVVAAKLVAAQEQKLGDLLARAETASRARDEAGAEKLLRVAALISRADADDRLRQLPPAPPGQVSATGDGARVKVFWQRGPGHDQGTVYAVARTTGRAPAAPGDGTQVHLGSGTECSDSGAPVATEVQYGVFAIAEGRPPSRPAVVPVTPLPPVWNLRPETGGSGTVTLRWEARPEAQVRVTRAMPGAAPDPVPVTGHSVQLRGLQDGIAQRFEVVAVYQGAGGAELAALPQHVTATPRGEPKPNDTLTVTAFQAAGRTRVRVAWKQVDTSDIAILRTDGEQPWPFATVITREAAGRAGTLLSGYVEKNGGECTLEVVLPGGMHYLTPLSEGGTGVAVGRSKSVAVMETVTDIKATPFADHATIAWRWPDGVHLAEVSWAVQGDEDAGGYYRLSRAEYESRGGAQVKLGAQPVVVEVRALITSGGRQHPSPPASVTIAKVVKTPIRYRVSGGGPFGGRGRKVTFTADEPCSGTTVRMIAVPGLVIPTKPSEGVVVFEATLTLAPGIAVEQKAEIPKAINTRKPFWMRCFITSGPGRLLDPPVGDLKEG